MNRRLIPAVIVAGLVAAASPVAANAAAPTDVDPTPFSLGQICSFEDSVTGSLTGKSNTITKPEKGLTIITSPGQRITLSANGKTVSYVITGTRFERTVEGSPITEVKVTGRNILVNGPGTATPGIFLVVGNFDFALNATGEERGFDPDGPGQVIDVCQALS